MMSADKVREENGNEIALVLLCCRVYFGSATMEEIHFFIGKFPPDWPHFRKLCYLHRVRPIVYRVLLRAGLPGDLFAEIKKESLSIAIANLQQAIETERIIILLKEGNIPAAAYKGTAFSKQLYGDTSYRESSDIDLVIAAEYIGEAVRILEEDGYLSELKDVYQYLGSNYFDYYKDYNLNKYSGRERKFHLELHVKFFENYLGIHEPDELTHDLDHDFLLVKSPVTVISKRSHILAVFIHHAFKDTFKSLKNIADLCQGLQEEPGLKTCPELVRSFELSIGLCREIMGVELAHYPRNEHIDKFLPHFIRQLFAVNLKDAPHLKKSSVLADQFLLRDSGVEKFRFTMRYLRFLLLPMQADFRAFWLPKPLFFLYFLLKPFRVMVSPFNIADERKKLVPPD